MIFYSHRAERLTPPEDEGGEKVVSFTEIVKLITEVIKLLAAVISWINQKKK